MYDIVRKELLEGLLNFRISSALAFTVILAVVVTVVRSGDFSARVEAYEERASSNQERLSATRTYQRLRPDIVAAPQPLSIFYEGVDRSAGTAVGIAYDSIPVEARYLTGNSNHFLRNIVRIDFSTVVVMLYGFLAVILGFDAIVGERERGTLTQLLSNPVPRRRVILAKLIASLAMLWGTLLIAFVFCLAIVAANDDVHIDGDGWIRLGILILLCCLLLAQVYSLSLAASTFASSSATSLVICLFGWLILGVGFMNAIPSVARYVIPTAPYQTFVAERNRLRAEYQQELQRWEERHPSPAPMYLQGIERNGVLRFAHPRGYEWLQERNAFAAERSIDLARRVYQARRVHFDPLCEQARLVDRWALLSPLTSFRFMAKVVTHTSIEDKFRLHQAARDYRENVISYLRGIKAFADRRWFSDDPPYQEPLIPDPESLDPDDLLPNSPHVKARLAWAEEEDRKAASDPSRELDLTNLPRFKPDFQASLSESLSRLITPLATSVAIFVAALLASVRRFERYDPRL